MRRLLGFVIVGLVLAPVLLTAARFAHTDLSGPVLAASFASYSVLVFLVIFVVGVVLLAGVPRPPSGWFCAGLGLAGLVVQAVTLVPLFTSDGEGEPDLVVMSSNLQFGRGDPLTVVRTVAADDVDVLVLQEVTPAGLRGLATAGLDDLLPFRRGTPATTAAGTMVFSRYRLGVARGFPLGNGGLDVRVSAPEPFRLLAVHTFQPVQSPGPWLRDMDAVRRRAAAAVEAGATLVVGDFNATHDHQPFRAVLDTGLRDAAEEAGSGWQPTWPTSYRESWLRPLIAIDHVLATDEFVAVDTRTVLVPRTDHLSLVAGLKWRERD